ncbi:MAG: PstS family phosphate ABC transporter substrate-binding protein [Alphaproteobacteria bacterium]|nr:PstS family phosphate ABC transporter substrate-binding protein [Alphaproteobacteria bacterium]
MRFITPLVAAMALCVSATAAQAREQIRIVGSSTVFPFISAAAEQFGQGGKFKTPIVESTGTGGGFKLFCAGVGETTPDISNASRAITASEKADCKKNGVVKITEVPIGYDGIVVANALGNKPVNLTKKQIFMALAAKLPDAKGALVANPYKKWSDIDKSLPGSDIEVYGPPPTSGTRDAFVEMVMDEGCKEVAAFAKAIADEKARKKACGMIREDGRYIDSGEDDNVIVQKLASNKNALGIFGYSFLEENKGKVQGNPVEGIAPTSETIENGTYKVARSLYIYVKGEHIGVVPGIAEFVKQLTSKDAVGEHGYLIAKGLLPLHPDMQKTAREAAKSLKDAK